VRKRYGAAVVVAAGGIAACVSVELGQVRQYDVVLTGQTNFPSGAGSAMLSIGAKDNIEDDNLLPNITYTGECGTSGTAFQFSSMDAGPFSGSSALVSQNCGAVGLIAPANHGGNCTYDFTAMFTPAHPGTASCAVQFPWTNAAGSGQSSGILTASFTGSGSGSSFSMTVTPSSPQQLKFTDVPVNTTSQSQPITITNDGMQPIDVTISANPANFTATLVGSSGPIPKGQMQTYNVVCNAGPTVATYNGMYTFTLTQDGSMKTTPVTCNSIMTSLDIAPTPAAFNLLVGEPGTVVVTVTNTGSIGGMYTCSLSGADLGDLKILSSSPTCTGAGSFLGSGAAGMITLQYTPTATHSGAFTGTMPVQVGADVRRNGLVGNAAVGAVATTPASVDFGEVCAGRAPAPQHVNAYALAAGEFDLDSITPPAMANVFQVQPNPGNASSHLLGNQGNLFEYDIAMTPPAVTAPTEINDKFTVNGKIPAVKPPNSPSQDVLLHATVKPCAGGSGTKDRETYYACSTGRPVSLAPLAIALAFALRRRRR
jgi:hypothetical protein